ncbi:MAG: C40 family peptidase [Chitinophagaceae bacterium]|nr:C40 family peptidase [Chitinophagaceae bacterium]
MRPIVLISLLLLAACNNGMEDKKPPVVDCMPAVAVSAVDTPAAGSAAVGQADSFTTDLPKINTGQVKPDSLVAFAKTLIGTPYVYASTDPKVGFDCSGFITYVFKHFNIAVPRSSVDFTNVGQTIAVAEAKKGDLILFTGTNPSELGIGHMGLVVSNDAAGLQFIHATSGKAMAVTITPLNELYKKRFVRISRIFPGANQPKAIATR